MTYSSVLSRLSKFTKNDWYSATEVAVKILQTFFLVSVFESLLNHRRHLPQASC